MKLSRRGKHTNHARRGKHTKRAGKHLRYKGKKVRGSKRYSRGRGGGRVRTYKRGRRFQRGGDQTIVCDFPKERGYEGFYVLTLENKDLFFTKRGVLIQGNPSQEFKITLRVSDIKSLFQRNLSRSLFDVIFTRNNTNSRRVEKIIRDLRYFTNPEKQAKTLVSIPDGNGYSVDAVYNFSDDKQKRNNIFFKAIQTCIITKLIDELNNFQFFLDGCKIRIFSLSFEDARKYLEGNLGVGDCMKDNKGILLKILSGYGGYTTETFLSFFDCVYVNSSGDIDEDKTHLQVQFIPFNRFGIFASYDDSMNLELSYTLMQSLRIRLQRMMKDISNQIDELKTQNESPLDDDTKYANMDTTIQNLQLLVEDNICIGFAARKNRCHKIDEGLAKFVIEKSKDKAEYRDYDGAVDYIPRDLLPPSTASE